MCIAFFGFEAFPAHPELKFLLAFGRDEFLARPTRAAHFWEDAPLILAGRDLQAGGTWLGVTSTGRLAFLTNLRERDPDPGDVHENHHLSRGSLTTQFLMGQQSPQEYIQSISRESYHGFNLVVADLVSGQMAYAANPLPRQAQEMLGPAVEEEEEAKEGEEKREEEEEGFQDPARSSNDTTGCCTAQGHATSPCTAAGHPSSTSGVHGTAFCTSELPGPVQNGAMEAGQQPQHGGMPHQHDMAAEVLAGPIMLQPGLLYGVSNGLLNEWPKVHAGLRDMHHHMACTAQEERYTSAQEAVQAQPLPWQQIFGQVLGDPTKHPELVDKNGGREYICSSRFIDVVDMDKLGSYGTRSQTVLAVWQNGTAELRERHLEAAAMTWEEVAHSFCIKPARQTNTVELQQSTC